MQNKLSLLRFYPFSVGRPVTHTTVAQRAIHEAVMAGDGPIDLKFTGFKHRVNDNLTITVYAELYDHIKSIDEYTEFPLQMAPGSAAVMIATHNHRGREYKFDYNLPHGEMYVRPDAWDSNMGKFLIAGSYFFKDSKENEYEVEVTPAMFNLPWVSHALSTDHDVDPVHESLNMLCLKHSDWAHAQALKECPNIDPMLMTTAHLANSFETVDGVMYGFGTTPNVDWTYIRAIGRCVYTVISAHNGRVILRNAKTQKLYYCNMDTFKKEFIRTNKNWTNADPAASAVHNCHNPRVAKEA